MSPQSYRTPVSLTARGPVLVMKYSNCTDVAAIARLFEALSVFQDNWADASRTLPKDTPRNTTISSRPRAETIFRLFVQSAIFIQSSETQDTNRFLLSRHPILSEGRRLKA